MVTKESPIHQQTEIETLDAAAKDVGHLDFESMRQCANAWLAVTHVLDELAYDWPNGNGTGQENAVASIRGLAQQAMDKETLVAFERVFWKAVELSGSRDFDHDVCKEVRDFRSLLDTLPGKTEVDRG